MSIYDFSSIKESNCVEGRDPFFEEAVKLILETGKASSSLIQRRLKLGYARSARLLDQLELAGVIGGARGANPREILVKQIDGVWQYIPPPPEPPHHEDSVEKEQSINWNKTKYATNRSDFFEINLGVDENKNKVVLNLEKYGNLFIIGSQFTAAKDLLNNILVESMAKYSPEELGIIVVDVNRIDIIVPRQDSHLLTPSIVEGEKSISAFKWVVTEIERRYKTLTEAGEVDIKKLNSRTGVKLIPNILVLINSFNQLMFFSASEIEDNISRIMETGKRVGVYIVIGTDYPSPSSMKSITANCPAKLVFKPTDKKIARDTGIPESANLKSPNEAILETMYEGKTKITIDKLNHKEIYKKIFE